MITKLNEKALNLNRKELIGEATYEEALVSMGYTLLTEKKEAGGVKNIVNDINDKPHHLSRFKHPQWGSILGSEEEIRLAALQDEVLIWEQRVGNDPDTIPYLEYIRDTLQGRIEELKG